MTKDYIPQKNIDANKEMPWPTNISELRSFLGSIIYYSKFIENLLVICVPLYEHLKKDNNSFQWSIEDEHLFQQLKNILTSSDTLVHYNPDLPIVVTSDASAKGAGAVIFQKFPEGILKPIAFASRAFSKTETHYSTTDKEALAIIFAVTRFHPKSKEITEGANTKLISVCFVVTLKIKFDSRSGIKTISKQTYDN